MNNIGVVNDIIDFIGTEISKLNKSLEENSWDHCDDDEAPDFNQREKDRSQIDAYKNILEHIKHIRI